MQKLININMITALGLDNLKPEEQERLILDISDIIYDSIISRSIMKLSSKDKTELEYMLSHNPSVDEIGEFIYKKVPHIDQIAEEEISLFKKTALDTFRTSIAV